MNQPVSESPDNESVLAAYDDYVMPIWKSLHVPVARAENCTLEDFDGNEYLDAFSGISVANVGHNNPAVTAAATDQLEEFVHGQVGLIGTNDNPFGLYRRLEASKTPAPINAGEVAPNDIVVPEGDTGIDPGPFVGDLQQIGANARIQEGSIKVLEDGVVTEAGETVTEAVANVLSELGIEPKEVGLDLKGVYSDGVLFDPADLAIDVEEYRADVQSAVASARNLSINADYPTAQTAPDAIRKAAAEAKSVGLAAAIESPDLLDDLISTADAQVRALAANVDDDEALPEELRGVAAPAPAGESTDESEEQATEEEEAAETDDGDDDDEDAGGEGLGAMFG